MSQRLHEFIVQNRSQIIERARVRVAGRTPGATVPAELEHGVSLFLTQLVAALAPLDAPDVRQALGAAHSKRISDSAAQHGHELLRNGFTVAQVVLVYGDVSQVVNELASEARAQIRAEDFQLFSRCLDDAMAGAVTAYGELRERDLAYEGTERLGVLAHELRNLLNTATLSFALLKEGRVALNGSIGAMHARSLSGLAALVERSLAEVRLGSGTPLLTPLSVNDFIAEIGVSAAMHAEGYGLELVVTPAPSDLFIHADRQLLGSALTNLLQNAFKFSHAHGTVSLSVRVREDRVLIDVCDQCGGLPAGKAAQVFEPFSRGSNRTGLGLGLGIALSAVRANAGDITVRDVPGTGCVFTIELPRYMSSSINAAAASAGLGSPASAAN
jgi:signal transduction histidine kinase